MRANLLSLGLLLGLAYAPASLHAQRLFDLGIKGGINLDDLTSSYTHTPVIGGNVGLFARVKPPIFPGVQGEALLSSIGTFATIEGQDVMVRSLTLQLPLFLVMSFGPVELHAGGYYDRNLAKSLNTDVNANLEGLPISVNDLSDGSFGLLGGAGIRLSRFYAAVRYNYGLESVGSGPYLGDVKSRQVQLYIGWGFFK